YMCDMVYLVADGPVPVVPWDQENPAFHVDLPREEDRPVVERFGGRFVVYVGAHTGCGCGFSHGANEDGDDGDDRSRNRESASRLAAYLDARLTEYQSVELFVCLSGEEHEAARHHDVLTPAEVAGSTFWFADWDGDRGEGNQHLTVLRPDRWREEILRERATE